AVAHGGHALFVVELHLARLEAPVLPARLAAGEAALHHPEAILAEEFDAFAGAAHRRVLALKDIARLLEHAGVVPGVVAQARPEETADAALHAHAAVGFDAAELLVEAQELGIDGEIFALEFHPAARRHLEFGDALDAVGLDGARLLRLRRLGRRGHLRPRHRRPAQQDQESC